MSVAGRVAERWHLATGTARASLLEASNQTESYRIESSSKFEREAKTPAKCPIPDDRWPALLWVQTFAACHLVLPASTASRGRMLHQESSLEHATSLHWSALNIGFLN